MGRSTTTTDPDRRLNRRRLLQLSGLTGTALFAGCFTDDDPPDEDGTDTPTPGTDTPGEGGTDTPGTDTPGTDTPSEDDGDDEPALDPEDLAYVTDEPRDLIQITAGGEDLGGESDQGHFYYDEVSGDFDVAVHCMDIEGSSGWEKSGIMVRDSLDPAAATVMVRRNPDGELDADASPTGVMWRSTDGEVSSAVDGSPAEWLRLKREGDTIEVYGSMTSMEWELFETFAVPDGVDLGEDVYVGLAATSVEWTDEETVIATFKDLSGLTPTANEDIGQPDHEGSLRVREGFPHVTTLEPRASADEGTLTLNAVLSLPEDLSEAECTFQYRRYDEREWTTTSTQTLTESGTFAETVEADRRRLYVVRALASVPGAPGIRATVPTEGAVLFRAGPPGADAGDGGGELSTGNSHFGLGDGFADPAPWLDDETPVIRITDPSYEPLYRAFRVPHERLIVFETSGVVDLDGEQLSIRTDECYVAGQTAPSPGITFVNGGLQIAADDCVLQHVRVRPGDYEKEGGWAPTAINVQESRENNVVDHCTVTWGIDENLTSGRSTNNTTFSNNLVAEALHDSTHSEGRHGMGSLINPDVRNIAMLGNVWAHNENRNPRLRLASTSVVVNNLIFNFDDGCWMDPQARASIVGNAYLQPRDNEPVVVSKSLDYGEGIPKAYLEDNFTDGDVPLSPSDDSFEELAERPLWPDGLEALPVEDTHDHNLTNAGARPADRTHHDERIVGLVRDREGDWIDSQDEVGGYPDLDVNTQPLDVPGSGTRAWLRERSEEVEGST